MNGIIGKSAAAPESFRAPTLFYRSARQGFGDLIRAVAGDGAGRILLPAFIGWSPREGSGVFDPVRESGVEAGFYGLKDDLGVDLGRLEAALAAAPCRLVLLIHYFGRTDPAAAEVKRLAGRHGAILVEDLAHGLFSAAAGSGAGSHGGANLFSLHKMFPLADGGMVQYRDPGLLSTQRETAPELARRILDFDWPAIAAARRRNFLALHERLAALPECGDGFELLWPVLAPRDVPQTLPVRIRRGSRDHVYEAMNAAGFGMTSLYHTLIDELQSGFPEMLALSRAITNFPVHQDVPEAAIEPMVAAFREAIST
jgi:dTDP-4-amino-4,6-dideoxygalactose transaminase